MGAVFVPIAEGEAIGNGPQLELLQHLEETHRPTTGRTNPYQHPSDHFLCGNMFFLNTLCTWTVHMEPGGNRSDVD